MSTVNDTQWGAMYAALTDQLKLSPKTFQLVYPFTGWTWPASNVGYTSASQYDFCATMPQWSATGAYHSSGTRFSDAYGMFLAVIDPVTNDPALALEISQQQQVVQGARNTYDLTYRAAADAYGRATGGSNDPVFSLWLTSTQGQTWGAAIKRDWAAYQSTLVTLEALLLQTQTPGLEGAIESYADRQYYTRYQDPALSNFPQMPGYAIAQTADAWVASVQADGGTPATIEFNVPLSATETFESSNPYANTWAGRAEPVDYPFFGAPAREALEAASRRGELADLNETMAIQISFAAWDTILISTDGWYDPDFVADRRDGPYVRGYSGEPNGDDVYLWGAGGAFDLRKTAMTVAYQATFKVDPDTVAGAALSRTENVATRVGPFVGEMAVRGSASTQSRMVSTRTATTPPSIFGVNVQVLPQ